MDDDLVRPVGAVRASAAIRKASDWTDSLRSRIWRQAFSATRKLATPKLRYRLLTRELDNWAIPPDQPDKPLADSGPVGRLIDTEA